MNPELTAPQATAPPKPRSSLRKKRHWMFGGAVAALWFLPIKQLSTEWMVNEQYSYGWAVPFLALYLFWERWKCRPEPNPTRYKVAVAAVAGALMVLLYALRLVDEANPDWRLLGWALCGAASGLSMCALLWGGGWPWLRHFIVPICFMIVAVPWPTGIENAVLQNLMRANSAISVETLAWSGLPSIQRGNVIEISTGLVGIEEACSGIRSLQTTLMITLFLGELYRFSLLRRATLIALGLLIVTICNVARTTTLVELSANSGPTAVAKWHDFIGMAILIISFVVIWLLARALRGKGTIDGEATDDQPGSGIRLPARRIPLMAIIAVIFWLALTELSTAVWYGSHERRMAKNTPWAVDWPVSRDNFRRMEIPERARGILKYNRGEAGSWSDKGGELWSVFFLQWNPGRAASQLVQSHQPDICLPASGMTLESKSEVKMIDVNGLRLPFQAYLFDSKGRPVHVFYCLWENSAAGPVENHERMTRRNRLRAVLQGRRNPGQQVLEIALWGYSTQSEAETALHEELSRIVRRSNS